MTDSFQVDPDQLAQHATDVERISQDMQVVKRVGQTALPDDAYGLIGRPFASSLIQSDQQMRDKLGTYADGLSFHATRLRDTVQAYQDHDRATACNLNQMYPDDSAGSGAETRANGGGSGGGGSRGGRSGRIGGSENSGGGKSGGSGTSHGSAKADGDKAGGGSGKSGSGSGEEGPGSEGAPSGDGSSGLGRRAAPGSEAGNSTAGTGTPESISKALLGDDAGVDQGSGPGASHAGPRDGHHEEPPKDLGAVSDKQLGHLEHKVDHQLDQVEDKRDQLDARRDAIEHKLHGHRLGHHERVRLEHQLHGIDQQRDTLGHRHDELRRDYDKVGDELDKRDAQAHGHPIDRTEAGRPNDHPTPASPHHPAPATPVPAPAHRPFAGQPDPNGGAPGLGRPDWAQAEQAGVRTA
jgi:hypothetical protein